ncbi:hypothetical protein Baya_7031 [Bagarius yarrelli]|uniref:C2H2-type domain-containing protein n=1 Tax=Bagarius yarrelli TaxID=175774 RepID=A0A556TZ27_BAGYA|nr:hypothetical protein Baya_7031 [Bagarius yarrelli]
MNNFIGDLVAFSASSSNQLLKCTNNQSLRTAWESTIPDTPASKSCYPAQSVPSSQIQRKNIAGTSSQSGEGVQESTNCDEQQLGRPSLAGSSVEVQPKQADQAGSSQPMEHRLLSSRKNSEDGEIRSTLPYVCEDCGMRFQNAVSRNRHQAQQHYTEENDPNERHEGEQEEHVTKKTLL